MFSGDIYKWSVKFAAAEIMKLMGTQINVELIVIIFENISAILPSFKTAII